MLSPCGANCSFTLVLDVPYLECNTSTFNISSNDPENGWITYPDPDEPSTNVSSWTYYITTWTNYTLNATTYVPPYVEDVVTPYGNNTICSPARASTTSAPLALSQYAPEVTFPGFASDFDYGTQALNWTESLVSWYRDIQLVALISSMGDALSGSIAGENTLVADSTTGTFTVAPNTRFNNAYGIYTQREPTTIYQESDDSYSGGVYVPTNTYTVTPYLLNSALMNITLSAMSEFGWWKTNGTSLTQWEAINVYSFSRPLNLIIPYFSTLLLALPLLLMGGFALFTNGVPAVDGGFLQLLTTTTGSHKLDNLAAGNCLGGKHNVSEELKSLRIRFGEFICEEKEVANAVRQAGFGTEEETVPLKKGVVYGY